MNSVPVSALSQEREREREKYVQNKNEWRE